MTQEAAQQSIEPVDDLVRAGFIQELMRQFRTRSVFVTSPDMTENVKKMFGNKQPSYPYMFALITNTSPNPDSYNSRRLSSQGVPVTMNRDGKQFQAARIIPVNFDVELTFITNNYDGMDVQTVNGFIRRWHLSRRTNALNFEIEYGLLRLTVGSTLSESLAVPKRDSPADTESVYPVIANLTIHGFVSEPALLTRGRINQVVLAEDIAVPPGGQFFPF